MMTCCLTTMVEATWAQPGGTNATLIFSGLK